MIPETAVAMLACTRIGAVHSVVFAGFSPDSLAGRIDDCRSSLVITADEGLRGGRKVPLKHNTDEALNKSLGDAKVIVVRHTGGEVAMHAGRDFWYHELADSVCADCPVEEMSAEDPLFILYTSGSTGKPKGVLHTTGGYLVWTSLTHQLVFDYHDGDIYWCAADVGWVTGHSYIVYGPLANGATTLMFEGVPNWPTPARVWEVVDKHKVNIIYTAPTALRALMGAGDDYVKRTSRASLKLLGTVGEPINPEAWEWYWKVVGEGRCPIVDTWWQTETGGMMITPLPGATDLKAGSATRPFFGVKPALVNAEGTPIDGPGAGNLIITDSWPGQMRTVYGDHKRFVDTYFMAYPGNYFTGDGCRRDEDGYYWITGRVDDVINVSGHRLGTAEIESALVAHEKVSEAAVVGYPHADQGPGHLRLHHADARRDAVGRAAQGADPVGAPRDRPLRRAGAHPVLARPAQDPLGQDHAPHPEEDRRGRFLQSRRHHDARRSRRDRRPDRQPAEQARSRRDRRGAGGRPRAASLPAAAKSASLSRRPRPVRTSCRACRRRRGAPDRSPASPRARFSPSGTVVTSASTRP